MTAMTKEDREEVDEHRRWCARKVQAEESCGLDVWPAGWTPEQRDAAREVGRKFLAHNKEQS